MPGVTVNEMPEIRRMLMLYCLTVVAEGYLFIQALFEALTLHPSDCNDPKLD